MSNFRVDLSTFRGPLDLLLYLVRKHEVEIVDLPIAKIADQFLAYLDVLVQLDINSVGDFLEVASTLAEMKSRLVLPSGGEEPEELEDPREDLVRRLLDYKKFKDAASMLEERGRKWQEHYPRLANDLEPRQQNLAEEPIHGLELWDLVSAFGRILRGHKVANPASIVYDDTPIHVYMRRIDEQLRQRGPIPLSELFQPGMHKTKLIGLFLAVLELVRHHGAKTEQQGDFGEIWIIPGESPGQIDASAVDEYGGSAERGARSAE